MIIQYYADSLGLPRPGFVYLDERYIYLFERWLREKDNNADIFLINRARRGSTIDQLYEVFKEDEEYIKGEKDILIIHEGVCDCAPRPVSSRLRKLISKLPPFLKHRIIHYLHNNRAKILKRGFIHYLVNPQEYERILTEWLSGAIKNFKRIYVFNIAPTNRDIEAHSPGFSASIKAYNGIINKVVADIDNSRITIVDVYSIINQYKEIDDLIIKEDGHHITALGHKMYAEMLIEMEQRQRR